MRLIPFILQAYLWADPVVIAPFLDIKNNFMGSWPITCLYPFSALYSAGVIIISFYRFMKGE